MKREEFYIDNASSINHRLSGKSSATTVLSANETDVKMLFKKDGWRFNWRTEHKHPNRQIYKLVIDGSHEIQGLISIEPKVIEKFIELPLIESAPHNVGSAKRFSGVAGNLVAFACKMSFELGLEGYVGFYAKTRLVQHYIDTLGANLINRNNRMAITTENARKLVNSHFKNFIP